MLYKAEHIRRKRGKKQHFSKKMAALCLGLLLVISVSIGGTIAWLTDGPIQLLNTFEPAEVPGEIEENFDGTTKENVQIKNEGNVDAYIRVKLVGYEQDDSGNVIAGSGDFLADIETQIGNPAGWIKIDGYYYCKVPVKPNEKTPVLIDKCTLEKGQVLEILSESIQSEPSKVVQDIWRVALDDNGNITGKEGA